MGGAQLRRHRDRARCAGGYRALATQSGTPEFARTPDIDWETLDWETLDWETRVSDDFDQLRELRPDRVQPDDPVEPTVFAREKERLMSTIDTTRETAKLLWKMPDIYPRLAYEDERAALDYLTRVFQLVEIREARTETEES